MRSRGLEILQLALVVAGSSLAWMALARRGLGLPREGVRPAIRRLFEWVGLTMLLYAANVAFGITLTLLLRKTGLFVSMYGSADVMLLILAALQAYVLRAWID